MGAKAKRLLQIILFAFLIIAIRVWHLEVVQRDEKLKEAQQPKRRTIIERASRGTIYDRFGIPLAINRICYKAAIYYNQIAQIPSISWQDKKKIYPRREYIKKLSLELGKILSLDPSRIEDLIHSKASLFPHVPFILKSGLTEEEHYRLCNLEKDWLAIHAEIGSERVYPMKRVGCEIIGTMGAISSKEYLGIADEIKRLQNTVDSWESATEDAAIRLQELREKAYTIQDLVGKTGIEGKFEEELRGFYGKKVYEVDSKGKRLKEQIGGRGAIPGQQIDLSISIELQEYAEALLAENEQLREGRSLGFDPESKTRKELKQPWIKGASIVAMDPNTGEILAMASTPRFDPNDYIPSSNPTIQAAKQRNINRWLENEALVAAIWDGKMPLIRERYTPKKGFYEECIPLTWEKFLDLTLPNGTLKTLLVNCDVKTAIQIQEDYETLLYYRNKTDPEAIGASKRLDAYPILESDRLFFIDLCRLAVHAPAFTDESIKILGGLKIEQYRTLNQAIVRLEEQLKEESREKFHNGAFKTWQEEHQKDFLAAMRAKEKERKTSARPYLDYLDQKERELFEMDWKERRLDELEKAVAADKTFAILTKVPEQTKALLHTFRSFADLQRPLLSTYPKVRKQKTGEQTEKHLAASFYPTGGFGYSSSYAFQGLAPQGSIFKLVTAYAALMQTKGENPLIIIDEHRRDPTAPPSKTHIVALATDGTPYHRIYKGGRLPRSSSPRIGKIDLAGAIEHTSNPYFSLLAGDILRDPEDLNMAARAFGYGSTTGIDLIGEGRGVLPDDLSTNKTGLYSMAIGQHKLLVTPLQTAVMLSTIANGGQVLKPLLTKQFTGTEPDRSPLNAFEAEEQELSYLGISFPLFTAAHPRSEQSATQNQEKIVRNIIAMPRSIRSHILDGMDRVLWTNKGTARPSIIRTLAAKPEWMQPFLDLRGQMVGKTGTAEVLINPNINPSSPAYMYKHTWFSAIAFDSARKDHPELVVIVHLRYSDAGKEGAPLASQMIHKWREIKRKYSQNTKSSL